MSEKIYAWLLRLYPSYFRNEYSDDALQLFRDRARDETGFFPRMRLWLDLLGDLAISAPREYRQARQALMSSSVRAWDGTPSFSVIRDKSPHPGSLLFGGVLSLAVLYAFSIGINQVRNFAALKTAGESATDASRLESAETKPSDLGSDSPPARQSGSLQQRDQKAETHVAASGAALFATPETELDAIERKRVIDGAIANLKEYYVYPEIAQKMADILLLHEHSGDYDAFTDGDAFADLMTRQMRDVSHDRHLALRHSTTKLPTGQSGPTREDLERYRKDMQRTNCTFEKVEVLPRNIGYVKFNAFPALSICRGTVIATMNRLQGAKAIIFDLRDNGGGSPETVALIATYLFDHRTHLNDIYNRKEDSARQYWTLPPLPGNRLADKPAYILTSASTFSGAEEFSYDLKMLKRATLVGETTAGGAHMAYEHRIDDHFKIRVPFARAINPISKTNWEGTGVEPDVKVDAADALKTAEKLARSGIQKQVSQYRHVP